MAQSEILFNANNMNQLFVLQYSTGQYNKFTPLFKELEEYLILLVAENPDEFNTLGGTRRMIKLADAKVEELIGQQNAQFLLDYPEFAEQQSEFASMSLERAVIAYNSSLPALSVIMKDVFRTPLVLSNVPITLDDLSKQITDKTKQNVNQSLFNGYASGLTNQQIIQSIRGTKTVKGAVPTSRLDTERVVRTALNHVGTTSRQRTYKENRDLVVGYQWLSTLDSRTSAICRDRDLEIFLYKDKFNPLPPAHYFCRSTTTPYLDPKSPLRLLDTKGTRASKGAEGGKSVSDDLSYYDWLKRQPASFQDEALGKTKGLIFRNSGLSAEEFRKVSVNQFGKPLTIDQLKEKNKQIASYLDG